MQSCCDNQMPMSGGTQSVGSTLTGGIQDVAGILPLIGTEQCESHVGSALKGGYLYAAAAPLSIFGSLGIVKCGIAVLIASFSVPKISFSFRKKFPVVKFSQDQWLGARTLENAGFEVPGTVAPLIAMDGTRYKAETRLIQILEEKNIDNPENISIEWKSQQWNIQLVVSTIFAAAMSSIPYVVLLVGPWHPTNAHTPWIFPVLRTVGSCLASVCCQFLIQSRVISLMKNRLLFMVIHRHLFDIISDYNTINKAELSKAESESNNAAASEINDAQSKSNETKPQLSGIKSASNETKSESNNQHFQWDVDLPAEECLWSLGQFLSSATKLAQLSDDPKQSRAHISIPMETPLHSEKQLDQIRTTFEDLHAKHPPDLALDRTFALVSWITLCLSLPAAVAGYVGCFTLVSASQDKGPLVWLLLEAALSIVRILVWASDPGFDEDTEITVELKLTEHPPLVTNEKTLPALVSDWDEDNKTLALVPERRFLEWITPYTGPLDQVRALKNLALYFTLSASNPDTNGRTYRYLFMTVFDFNTRIAVTLLAEKGVLQYFDTAVAWDRISSEMEATLQSVISKTHPWPTKDTILFDTLAQYYKSITDALNQTRKPDFMVSLPWNLTLLPKPTESNGQGKIPDLPPPTPHDQLYLKRGYEHQLKTKLIAKWSEWIFVGMRRMASDARNDCYEVLADATSEKAKWERTELDLQVGFEWTRRELFLLLSSIELEDILRVPMKECIDRICEERKDERSRERMRFEFEIGRQKRLEKERKGMEERMEREMKDASERAEREGRPWSNEGRFAPLPLWLNGLKFLDGQWSAGIKGGHSVLGHALSELDKLVERFAPYRILAESDKELPRFYFLRDLRKRFDSEHWHPQRKNERREMDATIKRIRDMDDPREHLDAAYKYPKPDREAAVRFALLAASSSKGKACSAIVYDVQGGNKEEVCDVIKKSTTRSVINVDPKIADSIPVNDHLLFLSCQGGKGQEPAFIQRNRDRWGDEQTSNSSMFYFSPRGVFPNSVYGRISTIAHIFLHLTTPSRIRVRLLHRAEGDISVSIQENGMELLNISQKFPQRFQLQDFKLDKREPGSYKLEVLPVSKPRAISFYYLRDILVEFLDDPIPDAKSSGSDSRVEIIDDGTSSHATKSFGSFRTAPRGDISDLVEPNPRMANIDMSI